MKGADKSGWTVLMHALGGRCGVDVLKLLLDNEASVGGKDSNGYDIMMRAVRHGHGVDVVKLLLDNGANIHGVDKKGATVLMHALYAKNSSDVLKLLLDNGASIEDTQIWEQRLAILDTRQQYSFITDNEWDGSVMITAVRRGYDVNVLQMLFQYGASLGSSDEEKRAMLTQVILFLVSEGVSEHSCYDQTENALVHSHTTSKRTDVLMLFIQQYMLNNVDDRHLFENITLHDLANIKGRNGNTPLMEELCDPGARNILVAKYLLSLGTGMNVTNRDEFSALMLLMAPRYEPELVSNDLKIVEWLTSEVTNTIGLVSIEDIDFQNKHGINALMIGCYYNNSNMIKMLVGLCDINKQEWETGSSALHVTVAINQRYQFLYETKSGHLQSSIFNKIPDGSTLKKEVQYEKRPRLKSMNVLLECGADVNIQDFEGRTAFFLACCTGDMQIAKKLLAAGANFNLTNFSGVSPFLAACQYGHSAMVPWLVRMDAHLYRDHVDDVGNSPLIVASAFIRKNVLTFLIGLGYDVEKKNKNGMTPLMVIADAPGDSAEAIVVPLLDLAEEIDPFADIDVDRIICLQLLLDAGADPNKRDNSHQTALHKASQYGRFDLVEILLKKKCDPQITDVHGNTALHLAIQHQHKDSAIELIRQMKDINVKNALGFSPLHTLCHFPKHNSFLDDLLEILIEQGAEVNSEDIRKASPLFTACKNLNLKMAQHLVQMGANTSKNCLGMTVIHEMMITWYPKTLQSSFADAVSWLTSAQKIDINDQDLFGLTALHLTCRDGKSAAAQMCLHFGADIHIADKNGLVPLAFAAQHPHTFKTVVNTFQAKHATLPLVAGKKDLANILSFAHYHNTFDEVCSILIMLAHEELPCSVAEINLDHLPKMLPSCEEEYASMSSWVCEHAAKHGDRVDFFRGLLAKYAVTVPFHHKRMIEQFMKQYATIIAKSHPAMIFETILSGSVGLGTKIIEANEYDIMCQLILNYSEVKVEGQPSSQIVTCLVSAPTDNLLIECKECAAVFSNGTLDRERLVSHFYEASAEAFTHPELWNLHPPIYRLSTSDITGANRTISCLEIAIHDEENPWLKATIDIVPSIVVPEVPEYCTIPKSLEYEGCRAVVKWFSDDPDNTQLFRLSFCIYDAEIFSKMPPVLKDAYKMAKIIIHDTFCPMLKNRHNLRASHLISSYTLKACVLQLYLHITEGRAMPITPFPDKVAAITTNTSSPIEEVMYWTSKIYHLLCVAMDTKPYPFLELIYLPGHNVLGDDKFREYREIALQYVTSLMNVVSPYQFQNQLIPYSNWSFNIPGDSST